MGEIVNLRMRRKQAARDAARVTGAENAALHGRTRLERAREAARAEQARRHLDGHEIERDDDPSG
jgi:hypothetical protein